MIMSTPLKKETNSPSELRDLKCGNLLLWGFSRLYRSFLMKRSQLTTHASMRLSR